MKYLYHIEVAPGLDYDCVAEADLEMHCGDTVVVKCERYQDTGVVTTCDRSKAVNLQELEKSRSQRSRGRQVEGHRVPDVLRVANEQDHARVAENDAQASSMQIKARERIAAHGLDMKLIHTHCSLDRRLVVFQFSADGRVDFRELLRDLSHQFRTRVELRQIGVRDEAAIQGGIGGCGRPFCCATFLRKFNSINVKMAKAQGLSLNPTNISGACGRLKCCLEYEVEQYRQDSRRPPKDENQGPSRDSIARTDQATGSDSKTSPEDSRDANTPGRRDPAAQSEKETRGDRGKQHDGRGENQQSGDNRKRGRRRRSRQNQRSRSGKPNAD